MSKNNNIMQYEGVLAPTFMSKDIENLTSEEAITSYIFIKNIEELITKRKNDLRQRLLKEETTKGSSVFIEGHKLTKRKTVRHYTDVSGMKKLLIEKGLDPDKFIEEVAVLKKSYVVNPSKINKLVERGFLTEDDIKPFHKETWSVVVKPSKELKTMLENANSALSGPSEDE